MKITKAQRLGMPGIVRRLRFASKLQKHGVQDNIPKAENQFCVARSKSAKAAPAHKEDLPTLFARYKRATPQQRQRFKWSPKELMQARYSWY